MTPSLEELRFMGRAEIITKVQHDALVERIDRNVWVRILAGCPLCPGGQVSLETPWNPTIFAPRPPTLPSEAARMFLEVTLETFAACYRTHFEERHGVKK